MILVDTSVWIEHLRKGSPRLRALLYENKVLNHPFVVGELACGNIRNRAEILGLLQTLPAARVASHEEVLSFVESQRLHGRGLGWIDVHLLASALLSASMLWSLDKEVVRVATGLKVSLI
jgi:hypothetical protein